MLGPDRVDLTVAVWNIVHMQVYLSMCITYISVSIPTQWAVAGRHWQLASYILLDLDMQTFFSMFPIIITVQHWMGTTIGMIGSSWVNLIVGQTWSLLGFSTFGSQPEAVVCINTTWYFLDIRLNIKVLQKLIRFTQLDPTKYKKILSYILVHAVSFQ